MTRKISLASTKVNLDFKDHDNRALNTGIKYEIEIFENKISSLIITPNDIKYFNLDKRKWSKISKEEFLKNARRRLILKDAKNWNKYCDIICVGDFVKFKGQRNTRVWKKILKINWNNGTLLCQQYREPIDDLEYITEYSSSTLLYKIRDWIPSKNWEENFEICPACRGYGMSIGISGDAYNVCSECGEMGKVRRENIF